MKRASPVSWRGKPLLRIQNRVCGGCSCVFQVKENSDHIFCSRKCFDEHKYELYTEIGFQHGHPCYHTDDQFRKGCHPWCEGLTKETDIRVARIAQNQIGRTQSPATRKLISLAKIGIKNPAHGEWVKKHQFGGNNPFYHKVHTQETKNLISSKAVGRPNPNPRGFGRYGYRDDVHCWFRSSWEANIARLLTYIGIRWEFEPQRIKLEGMSYLPDFFLPDQQLYIEVKGYFTDRSKLVMRQLLTQHPQFPIVIVDKTMYSTINRVYSRIISNWEVR